MERKKVSTCLGFSFSFSLGRGLGGLLVARMIFMMVRRFCTPNLLNRDVCVCECVCARDFRVCVSLSLIYFSWLGQQKL